MAAASLRGLEACPQLSVLYASQNRLFSLQGLEGCPKLWRVDVSDNPVRPALCVVQNNAVMCIHRALLDHPRVREYGDEQHRLVVHVRSTVSCLDTLRPGRERVPR